MDLEAIKRKLRALSNVTTERGASEAEALQAAGAMAKLLADHGLSVSDIEANHKTEANTPAENLFGDGKRLHDVVRCVGSIAEFFDCKAWTTTKAGAKRVVFFGFPQDTEAAREMASVVRDLMERDWSAYWRVHKHTSASSGQTARTSFMAGMAARIAKRLRDMKREQEQERRAQQIAHIPQEPNAPHEPHAQASTALVIVKAKAVNEAMAGLGYRFGAATARSRGRDHAARFAGDAAGQRANLGGATKQIA